MKKKPVLKKTDIKVMRDTWRGDIADLLSVPPHFLESIKSSKDWRKP